MSEEIKTELNEDDVNETVCFHLILEFNPRFAQNPTHFQEDDFKVTSEFDDTRQEDDTEGLEDLERVSVLKCPVRYRPNGEPYVVSESL